MRRDPNKIALTPEGRERAQSHIPGWDDLTDDRRDELALQWLRTQARPSHGRMGVEVEGSKVTVGTPTDKDKASYAITLYDTFATKSGEFLECRILEIVNFLSGHKSASDSHVNGLVAFIGGCQAENEMQAAFATQMAMTQFAANVAMAKAGSATTLETFNAYTNAATKLSRTFVAQAEAYNKLQRGGVQTVKHVNVYEGGQAVVADHVHHTGGSNGRSPEQAHATGNLGGSAPVLGHDPQGNGVPVPSGQREEAMPNAWRGEG